MSASARAVALGVTSVLVGVLLAATGTGAASTASEPPEPTGYVVLDRLLDERHGHLLEAVQGSRGPDAGEGVHVLDLDGGVVDAIPVDAPSTLTVAEDGRKAYVASGTTATIWEVDLATLTPRALPLAPAACPAHPAATGGLVYFVDRCAGSADGTQGEEASVGVLDPRTGRVAAGLLETIPGPLGADFPLSSDVRLETSPWSPGRLFVTTSWTSSVYDASRGPARLRLQGSISNQRTPFIHVPGGRAVVVGDRLRSLPDLDPLAQVPCPELHAVSSDGIWVCNLFDRGDRLLSFMTPAATQPYATASLPFATLGTNAVFEVLVGARSVYAVNPLGIVAMDPLRPTVAPLWGTSYLRLSVPASVERGEPFLASVQLSSVVPGGVVELWQETWPVPHRLLARGRVDDSGTFEALLTVDADGPISARYAGGPRVDGASDFARPTVLPPGAAPPPAAPSPGTPVQVEVTGARRDRDGTFRYRQASEVRVAARTRGRRTAARCVQLHTQVRTGRRWSEPVVSGCVRKSGRPGPVRLRLPVTAEPGEALRARVVWHRRLDGPVALSRWLTFRRVRG